MRTPEFKYTDPKASEWEISLSINGTRKHKNHSKFNRGAEYKTCFIKDCIKTFRRTRESGLCDDHGLHTNDLILKVRHSSSEVKLPSHREIIERLIDWATPRGFLLEPLFETLSIEILGNVPDISTLSGMTPLSEEHAAPIDVLFNKLVIPAINSVLPSEKPAYYQKLKTNTGDFPVRILAIILAGLIFCEESNRGDRWFYRNIDGDEAKTRQLGGAMPIAYFAARRFKWGLEMKEPLAKLF